MSSNLTEDELENIVKSRLLKEYFKRENLMFSNRFLTKLEKVSSDLYKFSIVYVTIKINEIVWNDSTLNTKITGLKSIIHH